VTGDPEVLARHCDIEGMWYRGSRRGSKLVGFAAAAAMKHTWVNYGLDPDWFDEEQGQSEAMLRKATVIENVWIPRGE
jgi:hypothetical protein